MSSLNKAVLLGRLGKDPEVRTMNNGNKVVSFSIATEETWRDKATGERKSKTEWHNVVIFNESIAKVAEQYLKKGMRCYIEGKITSRKWQDQQGNDKYTTEIVLQQYLGELCLLDPLPKDENVSTDKKEEKKAPPPMRELADDEIPF